MQIYPHFPLDVEYNRILLDPPWKYTSDKNKPKYSLLTKAELSCLPIN